MAMSGLHSVLITPNLLGSDGISCLSRQLLRVLPGPSVVLSFHDDPPGDGPAASSVRRSAGGNTARFLAEAARLAMETSRDTIVVCCHLHLAAVARTVAWRAGPGSPVTHLLCGIEAWVPLRPTERWALGSGRLVAISQHTARRFKAANPEFEQARIEICHPGLPQRATPPPSGAGSECPPGGPVWPGGRGPLLREPAGREPAALIVGRMSREEGYKGHELLIDLWPCVRQRCPNAQLWVVGEGDDRPRLESIVAERGLNGAINFTGRISEQALDDLYRRCRLFVLPSRDEGFGFVFLEAMRAGKPCIGARGAAEEIIEHEKTGFVVDPARPGEVLTAIAALFGDVALCDTLGRAGAARFAATFTDVQFATRFAPLLSTDWHEVSHAFVR